jgi:hypothetical protein
MVEEWELIKDVPAFTDEAGIDKNVLPHVTARQVFIAPGKPGTG